MSPAQDRVLATPELLEAILGQLPPRALLFAQRVSRYFQTTIAASPRLQHLLFFRAAPFKDPKKWLLNPLLRDLFVPWFVMPQHRLAMPTYESIELLDCFSNASKTDAFLRKEASWRRMLLVQPPPKVLSITTFLHAMGGDTASDARFSCEDSPSGGVAMGVLYDITESFLRHRIVSSFGLSVVESEEGPQITLYLLSTRQCCPNALVRKGDLRSRGAEVLVRDLDLVKREKCGRARLKMTWWDTDLSVEKGGVDSVEFEAWRKKRAPTSSSLSDV